MSKEIICETCNTTNYPGSKYCNNCGSQLPSLPSEICPNCDTPNATDRLYCDNCGSRLGTDTTPDTEDVDAEEKQPGKDDIFSLPARKPGDTGELDPSQSVPDWLKGITDTGKIDEGEPDESSLPKSMPRIEEIGSGEKAIDDLPAWLVDEHDSEPIIDAPPAISTEHYFDLIGDQAEDAGTESGAESSKAELPDWLTDLASPAIEDKVTTSADQTTADDALSEWLADISPAEANDALPDVDDDSPLDPDIFEDELAEFSQSGNVFQETDDEFDLEDFELAATVADESLSEISSSDSSLIEDAQVDESSEQPQLEDEMLDWLMETLPGTDTLPELLEAEGIVTGVETGQTDEDRADALTGDFETGEPTSTDMTNAGNIEQTAESEQTEITFTDALSDRTAESEADEPITADKDDDFIQTFTGLFEPVRAEGADLDWLTEADAEADMPEIEEPSKPSMSLGETNWLSELEALGDQAFVEDEEILEEVVEAEGDTPSDEPESEPKLTVADIVEEFENEADPPVEMESEREDWIAADTMLSNALKDELPDWLDELGPPVASDSSITEEDATISSAGLPEWIADLEPGAFQSGSGFSVSADLTDTMKPLQDIPEELLEADLPDWLEGAADMPAATDLPFASPTAMPDWLQQEEETSDLGEGLFGLDQPKSDDSDELATLLQELPPASPAEDHIVQADIPDWIKALKPSELTGGKSEVELEEVVQEFGPLAGISNVINIEPIITRSTANGTWQTFTTTTEQQKQAALLQQLSLTESDISEEVRPGIPTTQIWLRLFVTGLLFITVLLGLLQPNILSRDQNFIPLHVTNAYSTIEEAAGKPVLLAIEYTPALAGELDAQAKTLVDQLINNGSPIVTVSQYTAGTAVAQNLVKDQQSLGFLPGESVGLRQLGDCLKETASCDTLTGQSLAGETQQQLADVGLIIVLTGERDSLINWLEQVGSNTEVPIVAGVTQSLKPIAAPYFDDGRLLQGLIAGMPDTAVYQQMFYQKSSDTVNRQLSAQTLAQLLIVILLIAGGLWYGLTGMFSREESRQT